MRGGSRECWLDKRKRWVDFSLVRVRALRAVFLRVCITDVVDGVSDGEPAVALAFASDLSRAGPEPAASAAPAARPAHEEKQRVREPARAYAEGATCSMRMPFSSWRVSMSFFNTW